MKFENRYITTVETSREYCKYASRMCKMYKMESIVLGLIFVVMLFVGVTQHMGWNYIVVPALGIAISIFLFRCDSWQGKRVYDKRVKLYGNDFPETVYQFGDRILLSEREVKAYYDYISILEFREGNKYFFLMLDKENGLTIKKDSFTVGTALEFKEYMIDKIDRNRDGLGMKPQKR